MDETLACTIFSLHEQHTTSLVPFLAHNQVPADIVEYAFDRCVICMCT